MKNLKIFSGSSNLFLAKKIADYIGISLGSAEISNFSDGEIKIKFNENIRGTDVFLVQSTYPPADNLMELLIMLDAAKRASAKRVTAVIPYYGYARQDRKDKPRVSITAKLVANLITIAGADRILTMDLHSSQIQGFFDIPFDHLYASINFFECIKEMNLENVVVVSPDLGSVKMSRAYAKRFDAALAILDKRRPKPNSAEIVNVIGDVEGKNVIIVDDMVDTGGTILKAVKTLKEEGAKGINIFCTHPVLSGDAVQKLKDSEIKSFMVSDTIPLDDNKKIDKINVISVANLFGEAILRIYREESISSLFDWQNIQT
ncbi:ribose-phosphate diphosphokinase [candidate division KSB1 bacterium]